MRVNKMLDNTKLNKEEIAKLKILLESIEQEQHSGAKSYSVEELNSALKEIVNS